MTNLIKKYWVWVLAVLLVLAALIWTLGSQGGDVVVSPAAPRTTAPAPDSPLDLVKRLKKVKIDTSFFNDPQFLDLESAPRPSLSGIQKGKANPFTPGKK